jgi:hypothetical protein
MYYFKPSEGIVKDFSGYSEVTKTWKSNRASKLQKRRILSISVAVFNQIWSISMKSLAAFGTLAERADPVEHVSKP